MTYAFAFAQTPTPSTPSQPIVDENGIAIVDSNINFAQFASSDFPTDLPTVPEATQLFTEPAKKPDSQQLGTQQPDLQHPDLQQPPQTPSATLAAVLLAAETLTQNPPVREPSTEPIKDKTTVPMPAVPNAPVVESAPSLASQELSPSPSSTPIEVVQSLTQPWWTDPQVIGAPNEAQHARELDELMWLAIQHSPYVRSLLIDPRIQEARATSALGVFDPTPFINSVFNDTSDPVGNTLTTGGPSRLNDHRWENSAGVRGRGQAGGQTELSQEMNLLDSNSVFFIPGQQADSRMVLRYTQPLMRGAGRAYNRSSYVVACLSSSESMFDVTTKIQQHAFTITTNYWELFYARANYLQCERGLERLVALRDQLAGRADLDSLKSQLYRADAQISNQRSQQASATAQMIASEAKLRAAVGAPELMTSDSPLVPITLPADWKPNLNVQSELGLALNCHPNILATHARIKAAKVRLKVAENELRPTLNLVMEGYARGLNGDYNIGSSLGDQFSQGSPSYSAGMTYQRPYRNVAAKAILREKRLEMQKLLFELDNTLLVINAEVESEIASAEAAFARLEAAVRATLAAHAELEYLTSRWTNAFLDANQSGTSLLLDQLLAAHVQLIQSENAWARAQADHMLALARVRLASGTLISAINSEQAP